ncbi:MAG: 6-carboxytetrahydropterin synthase, partial [Bacteroidales bacterium]|nr:6-carboxytetrahydropterin synthase [Bacteroidales bacterium]
STGAAEIPTEGMVMDFSQLKRMVEDTIIAQVDHALVLDERMDAALIEALRKVNTKLVLTPFTPTSENLLLWFAQTIADAIALRPDWTARGLRLQRLRLYETATSFAEWENI